MPAWFITSISTLPLYSQEKSEGPSRTLGSNFDVLLRAPTSEVLASTLLNGRLEMRYDLRKENGEVRWKLSEEDIRVLFGLGEATEKSACRITGTKEWHLVNDFLPLLKYETPFATPRGSSTWGGDRDCSVMSRDDLGRRAKTTALPAGWICLACGATLAWKFYTVHALFLVAIALGATAMATRQIRWGLTLIITAICSSIISFKIADYLLARELDAAFKPLVERIDRDLAHFDAAVTKETQAMNNLLASALASPMRLPSQSSPQPAAARPLSQWTAKELLEEISRLEELQRASRKAGRPVPGGTLEKLNRVQAAYDTLTVRGNR